MIIQLIMVGKTNLQYIQEGFDEYQKRLKHYIKFETKIITTPKTFSKLPVEQLKAKESRLIEQTLQTKNVFLLDERGKEYNSTQFAKLIENQMNTTNNITFVIGGAYGFDDKLKLKYPKIALSQMVFSHQLVRLVFIEQLYRAFTIINNQNYHH